MKSEYKKMSNMETFVSALLVFCLTCGLVWTNGGILAMASTELPSENLGAAKSEGTIVWGGGVPAPDRERMAPALCREPRCDLISMD